MVAEAKGKMIDIVSDLTSVGFLITKHITRKQLVLYLLAEIIGALLASFFVSIVIGNDANLGANTPNYSYPLSLIFGIEFLASAF